MPAAAIAAVSVNPGSQFLVGLSPTNCRTILAAATQRRFFTNSVITNQGHPADHLFLLTKGLVRYFLRKIGNRLEYRRASLVRFKEQQIRPARRPRARYDCVGARLRQLSGASLGLYKKRRSPYWWMTSMADGEHPSTRTVTIWCGRSATSTDEFSTASSFESSSMAGR